MDSGELAQAIPLYQSQALYAIMGELERATQDGAAYLLDIWEHTEELRISRASVSTSVPLPGEQDYRGLLAAMYRALATCNTCYMARTTVERFAHGFFQDTVATSFAHTLLAWLFLRLSQGAFNDWREPDRIRAHADRVTALDAAVSVGDDTILAVFAYYRAELAADDEQRKADKRTHRALPDRIAWDRLDTYCRYIAAQYTYARQSPQERDAVKQLRAVKREHARHHAAMRRSHGR